MSNLVRILTALLLFATVSDAAAEVLIYAGTVEHLATSDEPPVQKRKVYVVLDQFQRRIGFFSWGKDLIGKRHDFPNVQAIDYFTFPRTGGDEDGYATATAIDTFTSPTGGGYGSFFFHGVRVPVAIDVNGATKVVQPRAKILVGTVASGAITFLGGFYRYDTYKLKLDEKLTMEANGGGSTVDQAVVHLVGLVEVKGFVSK